MSGLELVPERSYTTTLRECAGGNESDDAVGYFLQKKFGERVLCIEATQLLLFDTETGSVADHVDVDGVVCVAYDGIEDVTAVRTLSPHRRLGIVEQQQVTAAIFVTALHSSTFDNKRWLRSREGSSLGERYPRVGIILDQPIKLLEMSEALPVKRPNLRLVE